MNIRNLLAAMYACSATMLMISNAAASDAWYTSVSASVTPATYSGSELRNSQLTSSLLLNAEYLDTFKVDLFYSNSLIDFNEFSGVDNDIVQHTYAGRIQHSIFSDTLSGSITPQITLHSISNNDIYRLSDEITAIAPKLAYLNYDKDLYFDIEYTLSTYPNNSNLEMTQWSGAIGIGFNDNADWIRIRPYLILSSDKNLSQDEDSLGSVDIKWTHGFGPNSFLAIRKFYASALIGKRIYAVDNEIFSVYNLADIQEGSLLAGTSWTIGKNIEITTLIGSEKYNYKPTNNRYTQNYLYFSLAKHW